MLIHGLSILVAGYSKLFTVNKKFSLKNDNKVYFQSKHIDILRVSLDLNHPTFYGYYKKLMIQFM